MLGKNNVLTEIFTPRIHGTCEAVTLSYGKEILHIKSGSRYGGETTNPVAQCNHKGSPEWKKKKK